MRKLSIFLSIFIITLFLSGAVSATSNSSGNTSAKVANPNIQYMQQEVDPYLIENLQVTLGASKVESLPPSERQGMPSIGNVSVPVFLIDFPDYPHSSNQTVAMANSNLFGNGDSSNYPFESLRNYYLRSSYGKLNITGDVFGWYRAKYNRNHYTSNDEVIKELLEYYNPKYDFAKYDNDGNGYLDSIYVYFSGPYELNGLWYCGYKGDWCTDPDYQVDGKKLKGYVWSWYYFAGGNFDEFATITTIHETGHLLGLPDYYDYDGVNWPDSGGNWPNGGVGAVDMMDGNADHNCFSKLLLGWIKPTIIASGEHYITLRPSGDYPDAVIVMPNITSGNLFTEFYMIQYRKKGVGNDPLVNNFNGDYPADGIVIWHVDATLTGGNFKYNNYNSPHKLLKLMEADGQEKIEYGFFASKNDFYTVNKSFGPDTYPKSNDYQGNYTGILIDNITSTGTAMRVRITIENNPPQKTLGQALDNNLSWVTGGSTPWQVESNYTMKGVDAVRSGQLPKVSDYKPWSWIGTTLDGPGQLNFNWKISARNGLDHLRLYIKDDNNTPTLLAEITGNVDWTSQTFNLGYGKHFLQWFYIKDNTSSTSGLDAGFLDNVEWNPSSIPLSEALDNNLNWDYDGIGWIGENQTSHDGSDAAQTCPVPAGQDFIHGNMETTLYGPGVLTFWWKISSPSGEDYMTFFDGATPLDWIVGNVDWTLKTFTLGDGEHYIKWEYGKSPRNGQDPSNAWVDQVLWTSTDTTPPTVTPNYGSGLYNHDLLVDLNLNEKGTIYYTSDGSTPTTKSDIYSTLKLNTTTTLKFFAVDLVGNTSTLYTINYSIDKIAPTAIANPLGGYYNTTPNILLNMSETGKIYYTLNGTTPTTSSLQYSALLPITASQTLKYMAVDSAGNHSQVYIQTYVIDKTAPTAYASPQAGSYKNTQTVALKMNEKGNIYYTLDGTTPTTSSTKYTTPLIIFTNRTLKFFAKDLAGNTSPIYNQNYTVKDVTSPIASASLAGGYYNITRTVILKMSEPGTIYYTLNGTTPTTGSAKYSNALVISSSKILKFFARDMVGNRSPIYTVRYIIDRIPPKIYSTNPTNLKTGIARTTTLTIKFGETIKTSTYWSSIKVKNLLTGKYITIMNKYIIGNTVYIKTSTRSASTWYQIIIPAKSVRDYAGNNLAITYAIKFKTGTKL